jgi:hypothetical protein
MSDPPVPPAAPGGVLPTAPGGVPTALAPHHLRMFALLVDYLLAVALLNMGARLLLGAEWDLRGPAPGLHLERLLGGLALLLLRDAIDGRSPGKWFMGIAAVRAADPAVAPRLPARLLRNLTLVLLPVEAVLVFVDPYCRRLGDRLAGTVVVEHAHPAPVTRRLLGMAAVFLATTLAIFLLEYWNVRRSAAYPLAVRVATAEPAVAEAFGPQPEFSAPGLTRSPDGARMVVQLAAEGPRGTGTVEVHLRLAAAPAHWELERVEVQGPPPTAPRVQDAPLR